MRKVASGVAFSVAAVAAVTGLVYALQPVAPTLSLGVLYVVAVVAVAMVHGLAYAIPASILSMLTLNFLFLPPTHTFALHDSANWVALAVYLVVAVTVGELATRSRRLAQEAVDAEMLRQSDRVKTSVLQAVGHDLRSPLTAIRTAAEVLENPELDVSARDRFDLIETIRLEARRLERLVANLLDLSRLEAGAARARRELWTVDDLLARALSELGAEGARVRVAANGDLPPVHVDAVQVERVLVNLLENALKFSSPSDAVEVDVVTDGRTLSVRVRDHGPGIPESDRERVFEAFERQGARAGNGLGLAIARGFAEANGGHVHAEGSADGGSVFVLELPAAAAPAQART